MTASILVGFLLGGVLLIAGAELLVRGSSRLALTFGISPLVVGLTVVAFGTSSPELAVTVASAYVGEADLALGNVIGSNILNILLILGVSALITPLTVAQQLVRLDVPLMIGASVLVLLLALDGTIGRADGLLLFSGVVAYTVFTIRQSRRETAQIQAEYEEAYGGEVAGSSWPLSVGLVVAGLGLLVFGADQLVDAAVTTATRLGISELVIGLTVVALGTSLPEVAASIVAAIRGERDIAVGNVVGSNLFNLLAVLGIGSAVAPEGMPVPPGAITFDLPVMIAVAVAALPIFFTGYTIGRWKGLLFLAYYVVYTVFLVLQATDHHALSALRAALIWFALPLTGITLLFLAARALRSRHGVVEGTRG